MRKLTSLLLLIPIAFFSSEHSLAKNIKNSSNKRGTSKLQKRKDTYLSEAIGKISIQRENVLMYAKRFKRDNSNNPDTLSRGILMYEEARNAFNALLYSIEMEYAIQEDAKRVLPSNQLFMNASKKCEVFIGYAKRNIKDSPVKLAAMGLDRVINFEFKQDLHLDSAFKEIGALLRYWVDEAGKSIVGTINYAQIRTQIALLKLPEFREIATTTEYAYLRIPEEERQTNKLHENVALKDLFLAKMKIQYAKDLMVEGNEDAAIKNYEKVSKLIEDIRMKNPEYLHKTTGLSDDVTKSMSLLLSK